MSSQHTNETNSHTATSDSAEVAGVVASQQAARAAEGAAGGCETGAPPSITAPANCIKPLRHGVDSLYLSFAGAIAPDLALQLQDMKQYAQATNDHVVARASIGVGDHFLTVLPRGRGRFAFVLEDNWFSIQLSNASAGVLPLALVQVRSEYLTAVGPDEAIRTITALVGQLGVVREPPRSAASISTRTSQRTTTWLPCPDITGSSGVRRARSTKRATSAPVCPSAPATN